MLLWLGFIVCTTAIVYAGTRLAKYGDIIAEKTGLGRAWIGLVLMASVTSLPELVTGISSVTYADVPDIAVGDVLGSCVFNMLILAILDTMYRPAPISTPSTSTASTSTMDRIAALRGSRDPARNPARISGSEAHPSPIRIRTIARDPPDHGNLRRSGGIPR